MSNYCNFLTYIFNHYLDLYPISMKVICNFRLIRVLGRNDKSTLKIFKWVKITLIYIYIYILDFFQIFGGPLRSQCRSATAAHRSSQINTK